MSETHSRSGAGGWKSRLTRSVGDAYARHADRRATAAPRDGAADARLAHQPLDALTADRDAVGSQVAVDPWRPVSAAARDVQLAHSLRQQPVGDRARRRRTDSPRVEA